MQYYKMMCEVGMLKPSELHEAEGWSMGIVMQVIPRSICGLLYGLAFLDIIECLYLIITIKK